MISERELWMCAQHVINHHGPDVDRFITERATSLAQAGDEAGVQAWRMIADRVDALRRVRGGDEPVH